MKFSGEAEVLEPEVLPPSGDRTAESTAPGGVNPILAGLIVDVVNIYLPPGLIGFIVGGSVGFWAANSNRSPVSFCLMIALATGIYCFSPLPPNPVPLATLVGVIIVLWRRWAK